MGEPGRSALGSAGDLQRKHGLGHPRRATEVRPKPGVGLRLHAVQRGDVPLGARQLHARLRGRLPVRRPFLGRRGQGADEELPDGNETRLRGPRRDPRQVRVEDGQEACQRKEQEGPRAEEGQRANDGDGQDRRRARLCDLQRLESDPVRAEHLFARDDAPEGDSVRVARRVLFDPAHRARGDPLRSDAGVRSSDRGRLPRDVVHAEPREYWRADCVDGGSLDLVPGSTSWPAGY